MTVKIKTRHLRTPFSFNDNTLVFSVLMLITVARTVALFITPLGLGVEEAQYWLWSQNPSFGYFTKPPLIAWIIGFSHGVFGHYEWAVRLPACWCHFAISVTLWKATEWLYGQKAGKIAALLWISLPATALGSFLISTDTPLLFCLSLAILAISGAASLRIKNTQAMVLAGAAVGAGLLAKYAAIYMIFGLLLIWLSQPFQTKLKITGVSLLIALIVTLIMVSPNLYWNLSNNFSTVRHLAHNANITSFNFNLYNTAEFLVGQIAVVGPITFALMLSVVIFFIKNSHGRWLVCLAAPSIIVITIQSLSSNANANWAMASYPPLVVWLAGWLSEEKSLGNKIPQLIRYRLAMITIILNFAISLCFIVVSITGSLGIFAPKSDPLKRLRGWKNLAMDIRHELQGYETNRIIADRRNAAAILNWHFYKQKVKIMVHDHDEIPTNYFEANYGWDPQIGSKLLVLSDNKNPPQNLNIQWQGLPETSINKISDWDQRIYFIHRGIE